MTCRHADLAFVDILACSTISGTGNKSGDTKLKAIFEQNMISKTLTTAYQQQEVNPYARCYELSKGT